MINEKTFLNYFLLLIWMGVIFYISGQPDLKSGLENRIDFILRKMAHITEYAILTFLAWRAFAGGEETAYSNFRRWSFLIYAIIFSALYAASDEYHQTFVAGRVGNTADILIDALGIAIAGAGIGKIAIKSKK